MLGFRINLCHPSEKGYLITCTYLLQKNLCHPSTSAEACSMWVSIYQSAMGSSVWVNLDSYSHHSRGKSVSGHSVTFGETVAVSSVEMNGAIAYEVSGICTEFCLFLEDTCDKFLQNIYCLCWDGYGVCVAIMQWSHYFASSSLTWYESSYW